MTNPDPSPEIVVSGEPPVEDMAKTIRMIEGLFHAINAGSFPLKCYQDMMVGMEFLKAVHSGLIKKLGPEEVNKIRQSEVFKAQAQAQPEAVAPGN